MFCINKMKHNSLVDFSHYFMKENANIKNEKTNKNAYKIIMLNGSLVIWIKNTQDTKHQHKKHIEYDGMKKDVKKNWFQLIFSPSHNMSAHFTFCLLH
jgi:hypothetical protein